MPPAAGGLRPPDPPNGERVKGGAAGLVLRSAGSLTGRRSCYSDKDEALEVRQDSRASCMESGGWSGSRRRRGQIFALVRPSARPPKTHLGGPGASGPRPPEAKK
ncbi:hypothetical protein C3Y92_16620 [Solidesulfovibrio carbinolicus]|uniref:Uncharacterized protein n=1 Tax=Solidesulfovibrio carbinolicus TaxID=296842 RepID=A0A4P6HTJ1_9BACT|nr:hypothetical protein C3Y92_16620 [Solidesulfovibrio carbinolicus]